MSDKPQTLRWIMELLKMKIVIFLIVMSSSAAQEVKNLTCTEGGSITLLDPVEEGFLLYGGTNAVLVTDRTVRVVQDSFRNRVFWNKDTGQFSITGLQTTDSGIYTVQSITGTLSNSYQITVYESVAEPGVNRSSVSTESCTLLCFVSKSHESRVTLSWYKGEERLNQSSTTDSLPLTVHKQHFNSSYRCDAANPADNKTRSVNFTQYCREGDRGNRTSENENRSWVLPVAVVVPLTFIALIIFGICFMKEKRKMCTQSQDSDKKEEEVLYSDVTIIDPRNRQGENVSGSSPAIDRSDLTTVYDKLEVHRMALSDTDTVYSVTTA